MPKKIWRNNKYPDLDLCLYEKFYVKSEADAYFEKLRSEIEWQHRKLRIFGKMVFEPRLTSFFGDNNSTYTYSGNCLAPKHFSVDLKQIKVEIEQQIKYKFNSCLANLYRDGSDSNGWHADDERELGKDPVIASLSLGSSRKFKLRRKDNHKEKLEILLTHGDLLIMRGKTQHFWRHQIPKTRKNVTERINLTFRKILD